LPARRGLEEVSSRCAACARDTCPWDGATGEGRRRLGLSGAGPELEEALPKRADLGADAGGGRDVAPQLLQQDVGRGGEQHPEGIRPELGAARPVQAEAGMELLDPVLDIPALAVQPVDMGQRLPEVGHHEAGVVPGVAPGQPHHLGLHDDPALAAPFLGGVAGLPVEVLGVASRLGQHARLAQQAADPLGQALVARHGHEVLHPLRVEESEQHWRRVAPIQPDPERRLREGRAELPEQAAQEPDRPPAGVGIAGPEDRRDEVLLALVVEGQEPHHREVAPTVVVAVEAGELLLPVGRVLRGIEVDGDAAHLRGVPARPVLGDDRIGQDMRQPHEVPGGDGVLEAGERPLGGRGVARHRIAAHHELVDGVVLEPGRIVAIGVAAGEPEAALPDAGGQVVLHLPHLAPLGETGGEARREAQPLADRFQQHRPAVGPLLGSV